jgi:Ni/Co efflux regulator RcnB
MIQRSIIRTAPTVLATVLALALAVPVVAADQPDRAGGQDRGQGQRAPDRGGNQPGRQSAGRPQGQGQPQGQMPRAQRQPAAPAAAPSVRQQRGQTGAQGQAGPTGQNRGQMPGRPVQQRSYQPAQVQQAPTRPAPRPAYVQGLRRNIQVQQRYRAGSYQAPQGYAQRRWSYGQRLPRNYYARNYWIGNFLLYALFAPPSGLVWVRVGHDALLIDRYDGEIIQVRYNVFY